MKSSPQPRRSRRPQRTVSIIGTGSYVPERILTNRDLEQLVETSDEWILTRTGISERRIAAPDEATSDMATKAAIAAMKQAEVEPEEIDLNAPSASFAPSLRIEFLNSSRLSQEKIA